MPPSSSSRLTGLFARKLPFPLFLAIRYLRSSRRDAFTTFLSAVAVMGIALGVAALILLPAALAGFQRLLKEDALSRTPHLAVQLPADLDGQELRTTLLGIDGVIDARVTVEGKGWLVHAGRVQPVEIVGYEGDLPDSFPPAADDLAQGEPTSGLYISQELNSRWSLFLGENLEVVSARSTLTPLGPQPRLRSVPLVGTYSGSQSELAERIAVPLDVAQSLLGQRRRRLEMTTGGLSEALKVAPAVQAQLPVGAMLQTWKDLNRPLLFALALERLMTFMAVSLIVVVASLALVADLALIISSKRTEIGMLGAMGTGRPAIRRAFVWLGGLLAGCGIVLGGSVGVALAFFFDKTKLLRVPGQVYFVDHVPFLVRPGDVAVVLILTLALALAASFYAARRATVLTPVEALRR